MAGVFKDGNGARIKVDNLAALKQDLADLTRVEVLVGFPEDTSEREDPDGNPVEITNAALGYIHDNGEPDLNIPARPFMIPGIEAARDRIIKQLLNCAKRVLAPSNNKGGVSINVEQGMQAVGLIAQAALRKKINEGIPPPLSEATLRERANRGGKSKGRQGALWELAWRAAGAPASTELAKPLIDTGQLRNAINYVIRDRKKRKG